MSVDKFGLMTRDAPSESGVSLSYINRNFLRRDGINPATSSLNMGGNRITNVKDPKNSKNAANKNYVDNELEKKLDSSVFYVTNGLKGIPVTEGLSFGLIPDLSSVTIDTEERVGSIKDPVGNFVFSQANDIKKPVLKNDNTTGRYYLEFDGVDDFLSCENFPSSSLSGGNGDEATVFLLVKTHEIKEQSQFEWSSDQSRFGVYLPWSNGTLFVGWGNSATGRLEVVGQQELTENVELWTIRVNGGRIRLYRGTDTLDPLKTDNITARLQQGSKGTFNIGKQNNGSFSKMDLYGFISYSRALTNYELKRMFVYFHNFRTKIHFAITDLVNDKDAGTTVYFRRPVISIHAEENGALVKDEYVFSFGNGCTGHNHKHAGYVMMYVGRVVGMSLLSVGDNGSDPGDVKVKLSVNKETSDSHEVTKPEGSTSAYIIFDNPWDVQAGDVINFVSVLTNRSTKITIVAALIEVYYHDRWN